MAVTTHNRHPTGAGPASPSRRSVVVHCPLESDVKFPQAVAEDLDVIGQAVDGVDEPLGGIGFSRHGRSIYPPLPAAATRGPQSSSGKRPSAIKSRRTLIASGGVR